MTDDEAIAALNAIDSIAGPEEAHVTADAILASAVDPSVQAAYARCWVRTGPWWYA